MPPLLRQLAAPSAALLLPLLLWPASATLAAEAKAYTFAIHGGSLSDALDSFSRVTGYEIAGRTDRLGGKTAPAVTGTLSAESALGRLLAGSGLTYRMAGPHSVAIFAPKEAPVAAPRDGAMMPEVVVTASRPGDPLPAYAGGQVAEGGQVGLLGNRSVFDTPFSTTNFTADLIKNQQARTVGDVLFNDPSVSTTWTRGSFLDRYQIRSFEVNGGDAAINGLFGITSYLIQQPEAFERIELFKGPNALLNGKVGSVGGSINYVTKRATTQPITELTSTYVSPGQFAPKSMSAGVTAKLGNSACASMAPMPMAPWRDNIKPANSLSPPSGWIIVSAGCGCPQT